MAKSKVSKPSDVAAREVPQEQVAGAAAYLESAASSDLPDLGVMNLPGSAESLNDEPLDDGSLPLPAGGKNERKTAPVSKDMASDFPSGLQDRANMGMTSSSSVPSSVIPGQTTATGQTTVLPPSGTAIPGTSTESVPEDLPPKTRLGIVFAATKATCFWCWSRISSIPHVDDIFDRILITFGMQRKPAGMLRRANTLARADRLVEAVKGYRDLLALKPLTVAAYDGLGRAYFRMGLTEEAHRELDIADSMERILRNRDDIDAAATLALSFLNRKQARVSISLIEPVLIAHFFSPGNKELLKSMGMVYTEIRAHKKSLQVYSAGLAQHPEDWEFHLYKGEAEVKQGNVSEGEKLIRWGRVIKKHMDNPGDPKAKMALGEMYISSQKESEGLALLEEAAALEPGSTGIRWRLYNLYQKQGQNEEALKYLLEVVALDKDNVELQYRLADFYKRNNCKEDAVTLYRELIELYKRDPKPHELLGGLLMETGHFDDGQQMKDLSLVLEIGLNPNPDHKDTIAFMKYLFSIGEHEEGRQWLERGLAKWPYHGELVLVKAKLLYNSRRYQEAMVLLRRLISVKSTVAEPHIWIAMCYQKLSDNMAALAEAQLATRLAPKSYTAHKVLGDILKEQKKLSQASAAYEVAEMMRHGKKIKD